MLEAGQHAPDFTLPSDSGKTVSLSDFKGQTVILYFYPKDDTPGCTTEAIDFSKFLPTLKNTVILGISKDSVASHQAFKEKHGLKVTLLADIDGKVCEAYGVWQEKKNYGKTYWGIVRTTYLIGPDGRVEKCWKNVKAQGHAEAVCSFKPA